MRYFGYSTIGFLMLIGMIGAELQLLQIVFRNRPGIREILYPNDPYRFWDGVGKIAKVGMLQLHQMGQRIRRRYSDFLGSTPAQADDSEHSLRLKAILYNARDEPCSSPTQCFISGLQKSSRDSQAHGEMTERRQKRLPLSYDELVCPQMNLVSSRIYDSEEGRQLIKKNKHLYEYWSIHSGMDVKNPTDARSLYETLQLEKSLNLTTPDWAERFWNDLKKQSNIHFSWISKSKNMQKLTAGPLLGMMIHNMEDHIHGYDEKKMHLYSGKHSNVAGLLSAFGAFDGLEPLFGSTVVLELHEFGDEFYVRVLYFHSSRPNMKLHPPEVVTLKGCSEYCPFETFRELTRPLIPENWEEECGLSTAGSSHSSILIVILMPALLVFGKHVHPRHVV